MQCEEARPPATALVDCPGCDRCAHNDGYVLRMSAGRPTKSHEYVFLLAKSERYYFDVDAVREPNLAASVKRAESPAAHPRGWHTTAVPISGGDGVMVDHLNPAGRNIRSVWTIPTEAYAGAHFATFPRALAQRCIMAGSSEWGCCPTCGAPWARVVDRVPMVVRPGPSREQRNEGGRLRTQVNGTMVQAPSAQTTGWRASCSHASAPVPCTVLDPFAGSGTVGEVAERLGRHSVLIELSPGYVKLIEARTAQRGLFAGACPAAYDAALGRGRKA